VTPSNTLRHVFAGALGNVASFAWDGAAGNPTYHHRDHLGSVHVETDSGGSVKEYILYSPFGDTLYDSQTDINQTARFKYTGKEKDSDTGYYFYGARYYNAGQGQFLSEDPLFIDLGSDLSPYNRNLNSLLTEPQLLNSYSYVANNPLVFIDPNGNDTYHHVNGDTEQKGEGDKNYYEQDDINMINRNAAEMENHKLDINRFVNHVKPNGDWDYKRQDRWFFFGGKLYNSEDFGNLHYGYVGTAAGIGSKILTDAAGTVQIYTGSSNAFFVLNNFDDPSDTRKIQQGATSYKNTHFNSSTLLAGLTNQMYQPGRKNTWQANRIYYNGSQMLRVVRGTARALSGLMK
jgi:RHS repeat-associated protein